MDRFFFLILHYSLSQSLKMKVGRLIICFVVYNQREYISMYTLDPTNGVSATYKIVEELFIFCSTYFFDLFGYNQSIVALFDIINIILHLCVLIKSNLYQMSSYRRCLITYCLILVDEIKKYSYPNSKLFYWTKLQILSSKIKCAHKYVIYSFRCRNR